jgi:hypothetical protein
MAYPVTTGGSFICTNGGSATLASQAKLTVTGDPVMLFSAASSLGPHTGCKYNDRSVTGPCTKTTVGSGGSAAKLTVSVTPALLDSIQATAGTPPPPVTVTVKAGQTKLTTS